MTPLPASLTDWLQRRHQTILRVQRVAGGCINDTLRLETTSGERWFIKTLEAAPSGFYASEARALERLAGASPLRVPGVIHQDQSFLVLEYLESAPECPDYWERLGIGLAALHRQTAPCFGLDFETWCGLTRQDNAPNADGHAFFANQRLRALARECRALGRLTDKDLRDIETICNGLPSRIPPQPASLLHGDLWSGNQMADARGEPVLIDPALYQGWREAELAMTTLFGRFPDRFYHAYQTAWPMEPGWESRLSLYNLYPLLNHLRLFGASYLSAVRDVLRTWR